jgi:hypothetical protein
MFNNGKVFLETADFNFLRPFDEGLGGVFPSTDILAQPEGSEIKLEIREEGLFIYGITMSICVFTVIVFSGLT